MVLIVTVNRRVKYMAYVYVMHQNILEETQKDFLTSPVMLLLSHVIRTEHNILVLLKYINKINLYKIVMCSLVLKYRYKRERYMLYRVLLQAELRINWSYLRWRWHYYYFSWSCLLLFMHELLPYTTKNQLRNVCFRGS